MLDVCEIFKSIQGESTYAGEICSFVRLAGCNLDCAYCDTRYARSEGVAMALDEVLKRVQHHQCQLAEVTGGEPMLQQETTALCQRLLELDKTVLVETNGTIDISVLPYGVVRIMDVKCPSSGMSERFLHQNLQNLTSMDEVKFVLSDRADFDWAAVFARKHLLYNRCPVIFSPNTRNLKPKHLADWILAENLPVRFGLQLHKVIWGEEARGV